jgi:F420H(2)-dependent quinone reductase
MSASHSPLTDGSRGRRIKESDRRLIRVFIGAHRRILARSGGRILGRMGGHPLLVLTTTGQRTGQPRSTPVIGIRNGGNWLVVASNGGAATQPLWLRNIAASPQVTVRRGKRAEPFHAQILPDPERAEWWPKLVRAYPSYARMQAKTDRELPVVLLTPAIIDGQATEPPST